MGIKGLTKLLADNAAGCMREQKLESYFGRKIAIDASMSIYQFLIVVGRQGTETLTNEAGEVTREGATEGLEEAKEEGKAEDIEKYSKRTVRVTRQHNEDCRRLLRLMGVPVVEAPSEAEAECANLAKQGKVFGVASEDMDALTFGAPKFLRHLMEPAARKLPVMEFDVAKVLELLNLSMDEFIDLCILGVGPTTVLKLIRQHKNIETILEKIGDKYQVPDPWPYVEARKLFKEPLVTPSEEVPEIKWTPPDEEGLVKFLVEENGFNLERVTKAIEKIKAAKNKASQGRCVSNASSILCFLLESFFKPSAAPASTTPKRKEPPPVQGGKGAGKAAAAKKGKRK
ncbi:unnamed protein product [Closterium sp. NIES-53]